MENIGSSEIIEESRDQSWEAGKECKAPTWNSRRSINIPVFMIMYVMYLMIFITTSNLEEANRIAHELLKRIAFQR